MTPFGSQAQAVAIQSDRKIVIGGIDSLGAASVLALLRYTSGGRLDLSFGRGGKVVKKNRGEVAGIAIQHNGRIVVLARRSPRNANQFGLALLRFMPNGSPDTGFGK